MKNIRLWMYTLNGTVWCPYCLTWSIIVSGLKMLVIRDCYMWVVKSQPYLASFPGSCVGEEEREPGTHCLHMRQVPLVASILRCTEITVNSAYLLKGCTSWLYSFWDSYGQLLTILLWQWQSQPRTQAHSRNRRKGPGIHCSRMRLISA